MFKFTLAYRTIHQLVNQDTTITHKIKLIQFVILNIYHPLRNISSPTACAL